MRNQSESPWYFLIPFNAIFAVGNLQLSVGKLKLLAPNFFNQ